MVAISSLGSLTLPTSIECPYFAYNGDTQRWRLGNFVLTFYPEVSHPLSLAFVGPRTCEQETSNEAPDDKRRSVKGYLGPLVNHKELCVYKAAVFVEGVYFRLETDFLSLVRFDGPSRTVPKQTEAFFILNLLLKLILFLDSVLHQEANCWRVCAEKLSLQV